MTTNINNSPEYACRTCAKQECGCKDTECQLPCHFYTEQAEQESETETIGVIMGGELVALVEEYQTGAWPIYAAPVQQAEQEPVAWRWETHNGYAYSEEHYEGEGGEPLYTTPPTAALAARQMRDAVIKKVESMYGAGALVSVQLIRNAIAALPVPEVQWRDLTTAELVDLAGKDEFLDDHFGYSEFDSESFARAVIAKFKEKNI